MTAPREVELKLELVSGTMEDLLAHPLLEQATPVPEKSGSLQATYYDTPDLAFRRAGFSLRIRGHGGCFVQTLKADRQGHGLALDRDEWEWPVQGNLDLDAVAAPPLRSLVTGSDVAQTLGPAFTLETDRRVFALSHEGALVEISLDRAEAKAGARTSRFVEVELELNKGEISALFSLARQFEDVAALRLSMLTKAERGYRLLADPADEAARAQPIAVPPEWNSAETFQAIARACLHQIVRNEEIVRRIRTPEALHQMRVGSRRLKSAISLFDTMLTDRESKAAINELRWIGRKLGRVRDIDVYIQTLHDRGLDLDRAALAEAHQRRVHAYDSLVRTFDKPRFMKAILLLAAWIEAGRWLSRKKARSVKARADSAEDRAGSELGRRWKWIRKRAPRIGDVDDQRRHRLRIRIKDLRYGIEFFTSTFPKRKAESRRKSMLAVLENLQDELGGMNDLVVSEQLFPDRTSAQKRHSKERMTKLMSHAKVSAKKLRGLKPFWG